MMALAQPFELLYEPDGEDRVVPMYRMQCPKCSTLAVKRQDGFVLGLHVVTCVGCGHSTYRVRSNGTVHGEEATHYTDE